MTPILTMNELPAMYMYIVQTPAWKGQWRSSIKGKVIYLGMFHTICILRLAHNNF